MTDRFDREVETLLPCVCDTQIGVGFGHLCEEAKYRPAVAARLRADAKAMEAWKACNVYPLEYREALDEIAVLRSQLAEAQKQVRDLREQQTEARKLLTDKRSGITNYGRWCKRLEQWLAANHTSE